MKKIGLFTSGADAPGMNAAIRAAVRTATSHGVETIGIRGGFSGMVEGDFLTINRAMTANIIDRGGTILHTSDFSEFDDQYARARAAENLKKAGVEAVVGIGGDDTMRGLHLLTREHHIPVVGVPATIDNDLYGSDFTIGFDTAVNTAAEAIDRIRDTADSNGRVYIIEVMGSQSGFIATYVGISCGADYIAIPETLTNVPDLHKKITAAKRRYVVVIGEGDEVGGAQDLANLLKDAYGLDIRVAVLGHLQRGGKPTVRDRVLATRLANSAVEILTSGMGNVMIGEINGNISHTTLPMSFERKKGLNEQLVQLAEIMG